MTLQDFDRWLTYSDKCNLLLLNTLNRAPQTLEASFETESDYNCVRKIMVHIIGAEERWIKYRIGGEEIPVIYEQRAATDADGLFSDAATIRNQTREYLARLKDEDLLRTIQVDMPRWNYSATLTIEEVLFHLLTHETHHRGQIIMALQRQGVDTPNLDYILIR